MNVAHPGSAASWRTFLITWLGQLVSLVGSGITSFAVGVKVFQDSGSVTLLALVSFFYVAPILVLSPFAGPLVDRWDRRRVMLFADVGAGAGAVSMFGLVAAARAGLWTLEPWHLLVPIALTSAFDAFRWPAYQATTALLVPKRHLGRANGLVELASGVGQVAAPALAAALVVRIGLERLLLLDVASFAFAVLSLLAVRFPAPPPSDAGRAARGSLAHQLRYGLQFVAARPGLLGLLLFSVMTNGVTAIVTVLVTPTVLRIADVPTLGTVFSVAGLGLLLGAIVTSAWGGPRRRVVGVFGFTLVAGTVLFFGAFEPTVPLVAAAAAAYLFTTPLVGSASMAIWQSKTPPDVQGRVFAARRMLVGTAAPVGHLIAGPLADRFELWLAPGGALAGSVGLVVGAGPGRGVGLLFVALGAVLICGVGVGMLFRPLRDVEGTLPDARIRVPAAEPEVRT